MEDGDGGVAMARKEKKGHNDMAHKEKMRICPVCGRPLHKGDLVDAQSVVEENLYDLGGVRIVDSHVRLECDVEHRFDEKGFTLDEPHELAVVVDAVFDESGSCVQFAITEILPG
jgi:hypothetical protein